MFAGGKKIWVVSGVLVIAGVAFFSGIYVGEKRIPEMKKITSLVNVEGDVLTAQVGVETEKVDFTPYWRVWNTLERKFIPFGTTMAEEIGAEDRMYRSIEGLVQSYGDPYTVFMQPQVAEDFKIATKGSLEGIGAVIGEKDGGLVVVGPLVGSPAEKAGLLSEDKILKVDGVETKGMVVDEAVKLIRGQGGTEVVLSIQRGDGEPYDVAIVRGTIEIPSTAHTVVEREVPKLAVQTDEKKPESSSDELPQVEVDEQGEVKMETQDFYLLSLFSFSQTSISAFERELQDFVKSNSDSLIIDLRGNPGGYIESAVQIASWFLPDGSVVVREYSGPDKKEVVHTSHSKELFKDGIPKIAILVDKGSASASEILAGALQEHGVATVVGTNTFGKGSVQELVSITDRLSLKITVARWYTPNGVSISQGGLTPDVLVDTNSSSTDPWLDEAIKVLSSK
jgi:carboxyl-terminal processing protease